MSNTENDGERYERNDPQNGRPKESDAAGIAVGSFVIIWGWIGGAPAWQAVPLGIAMMILTKRWYSKYD